jgi:hypothetical protein
LNGQFFIQLYHREPLSTSHDMHWIRFSYRFRATAPTTTLTLEDVTNLWDAGGGLFLDGLAVTPAEAPGPPPPPSTRQAPAAPTNLVAERVASTQIDLRWQDNSDNEQEFILWRRSGGGDYVRIGKVGANVTRFSDTGLQPSTTYSYLVRAWNPAGASRHSNELTVQTPAPPGSPAPNALVPPTALTATALSATAIRLTWQDNSSDEAAFVLYRQDPGGDSVKIATVPANSTSYVDQGLRPGTLYRYLVRAWNPQSGASRRSNEASATTPLAQ